MALVTAAPEYGAKFTLTGPDGTRAVFNDSTDVDYVGMLSEETSGLDSAEVREDAAELVEGDGGIHGDFFYGRRPVVLAGDIDGSAVSASVRNERIARLQKASQAMRGDAKLEWTPAGAGNPRTLETLRRSQALRISGAYHKKFMLPLVAADPRIYGPLATLEKTYTAPTGTTISTGSANKAPGTCSSSGTPAWENPNNVKVSDNVYATSTMTAAEKITGGLVVTNFGFTIPATARIAGVKLMIEAKANKTAALPCISLVSLQVSGIGKAVADPLTTSDVVYPYGGESDLWGSTLTAAIVNGVSFGATIQLGLAGTAETTIASIDAVTMTVYYEEGGEIHSETITNNGNTPSYPTIKVYGKSLSTFKLSNFSVGEEIVVLTALASSADSIEVNLLKKTAVLDGADASRYLHFPVGWWGLKPGANSLSFPASSKVIITYRDAWL